MWPVLDQRLRATFNGGTLRGPYMDVLEAEAGIGERCGRVHVPGVPTLTGGAIGGVATATLKASRTEQTQGG